MIEGKEASSGYKFLSSIKIHLKKLLIFNFLIILLAIAISFIIPKWYKASATILPTGNNSGGIGTLSALQSLGGLASGLLGGGISSDINRYLAILKSRNLREKVIRKYNLMREYGSKNMEEALKEFDDNLKVDVGNEMQIEISFLDKNQNKVADITNYIVHCLDSTNISLSVQEAKNNREFINSRLKIAIDSLLLLQNQLKNFMKKHGVLDIENQVIVGLQSIGELRTELLQKQVEFDVAKKQLRKNNALLRKLQTELEVFQKQYKKFFSDSLSKNRLIPPIDKIPDLYIKFSWLKKQIEYYEKIIEFLAPQYEQAKIQEAKTIPTIQILDYAVRPEKKYLPKRWLIVLITMLLSTTLSIYYVYWKEYIYNRYFT